MVWFLSYLYLYQHRYKFKFKTYKMKFATLLLASIVSASIFSCGARKKLAAQNTELNQRKQKLEQDLKDCHDITQALMNDKNTAVGKNTDLQSRLDDLNKQIDYLKANNNQALKQLENMSVISGQQAESIKKSMDNIGSKDNYIQTLQSSIARKDSMNMALVMNLKGAIGNMNDKDINIKVDKGVVYIDISDKLLFKSGSYDITPQASEVLGKVALVLKNQPDIEFMVEGHTDNVQYKGPILLDNWDLSTKRATSVVRILQKKYDLDPAKMTAAGRGEYAPVTDNSTGDGRASNRRTRIIILPQLDQFFKLLEPKKG